ncbi:MAG: 2Fe-2S iron-sulfur cluster binding domain-containing protein [Deltaproteobacteria bacterium]|nr:2Fe-2S iron-sulfur cluster binding domain-containing protein [Deltaproteobacteria bacterium]
MSARIRFEPDGVEAEVPVGTTIKEAAERCGAHLGSACGGVCACSTCHVYVKEGLDDLSAMEMAEEDRLDGAFDVRPNSRLGCQAVLRQDRGYVVEITRESLEAFFDEYPELRGGR